MTNKEAATIVERIRYYMEGGECWAPTEFEAMDMAIESLNRQDISDINVNDMIYRQMAIDALMDEFKRIPTMAIRAKHTIEQLPSAEPDVTRCGKCTHKDKKIDYCHYLGITICECDYCSYAVRRTDELGNS